MLDIKIQQQFSFKLSASKLIKNVDFQSDQISQACYMSNWYESHIAVRKILFIMMERTKRPFIVTAGGFFTLSLPTLVSVSFVYDITFF